MNNQVAVNIGEQRFDKLIEEHKFYIDKTGFVKEWWEYGSTVTLITRPRRFGKTLNMSMLECFFSNKYADRGDLFEGLSIWEEKTAAKEYQYRYLQVTFPVGKNVIILLDEYDSPMQAAWLSGYWDKAVSFFNGLFNSTFKTNPYLYRGGDNWNYKSCEKEYFFRTE